VVEDETSGNTRPGTIANITELKIASSHAEQGGIRKKTLNICDPWYRLLFGRSNKYPIACL